jgi:hypothetical protein
MSKDGLRQRIQERMDKLNNQGGLMADSITRAQLTEGLKRLNRTTNHGPVKFGEYWGVESLAADLFAAATAPKGGYNMTATNPNETLTVAELEKALRDLNYSAGFHANQIYSRVKLNREPQWKTDDIVRSDSGNVFRKLSNGDWQHEGGRDRSTVLDSNISRPLTLIGRAV